MLDQIEALLRERQEITERLSGNADFRRYLETEKALFSSLHGGQPRIVKAPSRRRSRTREISDQVDDILRQAHEPMQTRDIIAELARRGVKIGGKNPVTNLSAKLSADTRFKNERREGWKVDAPTKRIPLPAFLRP